MNDDGRLTNKPGNSRGAGRSSRQAARYGEAPGRTTVDARPLMGYLGYALRRAQMAAYTDFIATLQEVALSPGEFGVLTLIDLNPGLRPADVCSALGIRKPNLVAVLAALEGRGIIERRDAISDGRAYELYLTAGGRGLLRRARTLQAEHEARLARGLTKGEREQLLVLLGKLVVCTG